MTAVNPSVDALILSFSSAAPIELYLPRVHSVDSGQRGQGGGEEGKGGDGLLHDLARVPKTLLHPQVCLRNIQGRLASDAGLCR